MNILDIIKTRRSVREFKDLELPEKAIDILIEALRWAPSAGNLQSRNILEHLSILGSSLVF